MQSPQDDRVAGVVVQKAHQHFLPDGRPEGEPGRITPDAGGQSGPIALPLGVDGRYLDQDAFLPGGVVVHLDHGGGVESAYRRQQSSGRWCAYVEAFGKPLLPQAQLGGRFPLPVGDLVAQGGDVDESVEALPHTGQFDGIADGHRRRSLEGGRRPNGGQFAALGRTASPAAEGVGRQPAPVVPFDGVLPRPGGGFGDGLPGRGVPGEGRDLPVLVAGIQVGVEGE